jgi:SlyX protein
MNQSLEDRIVELEIKLSYADDLLEQLNTTVALQQSQLELLGRELRLLKQRDTNLPMGREEPPPHY